MKIIFIMYVSNASLNLEKQMVIPCNIFETFEIISYGKLSKFLTSPNFAFFNLDGEWDVEGIGVSPDYEVDATSEDMYEGIDTQLDKAIELINAGLKSNPPAKVVVPQFPIKTGVGNPK